MVRNFYETLLTREEIGKAEDCASYYRIVADTRDLNYNIYFTEGLEKGIPSRRLPFPQYV